MGTTDPTAYPLYDEILADNPVAFWPLTADGADHAGTRDLTVVGATFMADEQGDPFEGWVDTDGVDDYLETSSGIDLPGPMTIETWLWIPTSWGSAGTGAHPIGSNDRVGFRRAETTDRMGSVFRDDSGTDVGVDYGHWGDGYWDQAVPTFGAWQHWALTYDKSRTRAYLDGVLVADKDTSGNDLATGFDYFTFGAQRDQPTGGSLRRWFEGGIAFAATYDQALSATRIAAHYDAGTQGPSDGLTLTVDDVTSDSVTLSWS